MIKPVIATATAISLAHAAAAFELLYASDGDSLQGTAGEKARLLCIDAPELKQQGGEAAKRALQQLIAGDIAIKKRGKDRHNRHLVLLTHADGSSVNLALIRQGHAWVSRYFARTCGLPIDALYSAEKQARSEKRGLWRQPTPQPPWQWRKENPRD